jgi:biotin transport system substrate-specific component
MYNTVTLPNTKPIFRDACIVALASILITLSGAVSIPLWFTPIVLTTRNTLVYALAVALGPRRASLATLGFLVQGLMGFNIFAGSLSGPHGGYLIGYLVAACVTGFIIEKCKEKTGLNAFLAMTAGCLTTYACGAGYLATFIGVKQAILLGVAPFIVTDLLKIFAAVKAMQWLGWR